MSSTIAPSMPAVINEMLATKAIPELNETQHFEVTEYLFKRAGTRLRILVAEVAYRNYTHRDAFDLFLACAVAMAHKIAEGKAQKFFYRPSDWQVECLYDGAVAAAIILFQRHQLSGDFTMEQFSKYLLQTLSRAALYNYRRREENLKMDAVENLELVKPRQKAMRNEIEQEVITRELLEQIAQYPLLQRAMSKTLQCVIELGPDFALNDRKVNLAGYYNPETSKRYRGTIPSFNFEAIAKKRGISRSSVSDSIRMARTILNKAFNADGHLFCAH
jgi:predicted DNA-binding protein YlxM (UPF0122 family)